ncbi:hypothetical protein BJ138DRAFT_1138291 [Hygrophoropsis aurantiaca]|uniref:Uncharacterized protein n=1 Tax=Hygrophoropsis aurantiaca TaxID=72124 RepID=A0ACB7ZWH3_9AGAM|nr:hypothetical protein BJ138DRAFT_1138291 [Hygrophoropsis aurantiaca]
MHAEYGVWFRNPRELLRNQLSNPDLDGEFDYTPQRVYTEDNKWLWSDFMTGNWSWKQADVIAEDQKTHGSMFVPVILGSDKTTVTVGTGNNEYYPLYISNGNVHNNVRRAHRNAVGLVGFLAIPKTDEQYKNDPEFQKFRCNLFHSSLTAILEPLRAGMTAPEVTMAIYGLGPYIAGYPEQVLLVCIVQGWCAQCTAHRKDLDGDGQSCCHEHTLALMESFSSKDLWGVRPFTEGFPHADIHELLAPDLLHQIIKGTFKDHLVTWVNDIAAIIADIDRHIAAAPPFPGLRVEVLNRGFKQWTGNDSKALMKVYLPAITGHVPDQMVRAISAFLDFCYLVCHDTIDENTINAIEPDALQRFHAERTIFVDDHHIKAVKRPYRRTSKWKALGQMLLINQRIDKLERFWVIMTAKGMLDGALVPEYLSNLIETLPGEDINGHNQAGANEPDEDNNTEENEDEDEDESWHGAQIPGRVIHHHLW